MSLSNENMSCAFTWKIKNLRYLTGEIYQDLPSPTFRTPATGNRLLQLKLLSANQKDGKFVVRFSRICGEPIFIPIVCELSVLAANGADLYLTASNRDELPPLVISDFTCTLSEIVSNISQPEDTLIFRLKLQQNEAMHIECFVCTVFHQENFLWKIRNYRSAPPVVSKNFQLAYHQFVLNLFKINPSPTSEAVEIQTIQKFVATQSFLYYRLSILSPHGQELAKYDYNDFVTCSAVNNKCIKVVLKDDFLEDNMLLLKWEFTIGAGEFMHEDKAGDYGVSMTAASFFRNQLQKQTTASSTLENAPSTSKDASCSLKKDLMIMYKTRKFCDVTLKTEGKSFPAHKSVLCARSPVFHDMFETDMKESQTSIVDIPDIEPETIERMLMFLYTDFLDDINFDEAYSLYYAADKYTILTLKEACLSVLINELDVSNVCHALILADTHSDKRLMKSVKNFILDNNDVIHSHEWKLLEESRPNLIIHIFHEMRLKKGKF